ncbi:MAG: hypothetical protein U0325_13600 [Polyangiales bacterium]
MAKRPAVKSPFALHPSVTARCNLATTRAREITLSPDGALLLVQDDRRAALYDTRTGLKVKHGAGVDGARADHVAWSPRGDHFATLLRDDHGDGATVTLWDADTGAAAHTVTLARFGTFTHGLPGTAAPVMAFSPAGSALFVRSTPSISNGASYVWRIDVATGAAAEAKVPLRQNLESLVARNDDVVFLVFSGAGPNALCAWRFGDADALAAWEHAWGTCLGLAHETLWAAGDPRWLFGFDADALAAGKSPAPPSDAPLAHELKIAQPLRDARVEELSLRAKGRWYVEHFKWVQRREVDSARDDARHGHARWAPGVRAWLKAEPHPVAQAEPLGRGVVLRDGVSLVAVRRDGDALRELRLVEDLQKSAPQNARMACLATAGNVMAIAWDKSLGGGTALVHVVEVDLAAAGLAG